MCMSVCMCVGTGIGVCVYVEIWRSGVNVSHRPQWLQRALHIVKTQHVILTGSRSFTGTVMEKTQLARIKGTALRGADSVGQQSQACYSRQRFTSPLLWLVNHESSQGWLAGSRRYDFSLSLLFNIQIKHKEALERTVGLT